jgi:protoporphyrinogen oxidase
VEYRKSDSGTVEAIASDYCFSTMPINELFDAFTGPVPHKAREVARNLKFRDFITVGLLLKDEYLNTLSDNWIYIHDPEVKVGRVQLFRNWSPYMVGQEGMQLLGFEYFCNEHDPFWDMSNEEIGRLAAKELAHIGLASSEVAAFHVEKVPKAYPVYTGTYSDFQEVKSYLNSLTNFFPIGRNGMHRYNNQDHSMLTAMASVESILGTYKKEDVWNINAEEDYHEER